MFNGWSVDIPAGGSSKIWTNTFGITIRARLWLNTGYGNGGYTTTGFTYVGKSSVPYPSDHGQTNDIYDIAPGGTITIYSSSSWGIDGGLDWGEAPTPPNPTGIQQFSYFPICKTGVIYSPLQSSLSFAINDNNWTDNSGYYNLSLFSDEARNNLLISKNIDGSFPSWVPVYALQAGRTYYYQATGFVTNLVNQNNLSDGYTPYNVYGKSGIKGSEVSDLYESTGIHVNNFVSNAAIGQYFTDNIVNPFSDYAQLDISGYVKDQLFINGTKISYSVGQIGYEMVNFSSGILANQSISYNFYNTINNSIAGGDINFTFKKPINSFLIDSLDIYSLSARVNYSNANNQPACNLYIGCDGNQWNVPVPPVIPSGGDILPANGELYFDFSSSGTYCDNASGNISKIQKISYETNIKNNSNVDILKTLSSTSNSNADYVICAYYDSGDADLYSYATGYQTIISPNTYLTGAYSGISGYVSGTGYFINKSNSATDGTQIFCQTTGITGIYAISGLVTGITGMVTGVAWSGSGIVNYINLQIPTGVIATKLTPPDLEISVYNSGNLIDYNDDWINSNFYSYIKNNFITGSKENLKLSDSSPFGLYHVDGTDKNNFDIQIRNKSANSIESTNVKVLLSLNKDDYPIYSQYHEPTKEAWAIYDVRSGTNSKNVISFAIDIASGYVNTGKRIFNNSSGSLPEINYTGTDIRQQTITYCIAQNSCSQDESKVPQDISVCWTGAEPPNEEYDIFLSGVLKKFASSPYTPYDPPNPFVLQTGSVPAFFQYWSGEITYNGMQSGDSVKFDLYPFDYTGLYQQYFSSNPIYPTTGFTLTCFEDFTNIDGLVSGLNSRLSGISYPVWYPYDCVSGSGMQGIYVDGPILKAYKITGQSGTSNIVAFESLRNNTGFKLSLDLAYPRNQQESYKDTVVFLKPLTIELQGSNDKSSWTNLYSISGIDWTQIQPTRIEITGLQSGIDNSLFDNQQNNDNQGDQADVMAQLSTGFETLYTFTQSGAIRYKDKLCPPTYYERSVDIIKLTGVPFGTILDAKSCFPKDMPDQGSGSGNKDNQNPNSGSPQEPARYIDLLRTGWNLDSSYVGQPVTGIDYNYYRVYFNGLEATAKWNEEVANNFIVKNINLYGCNTIDIGTHTGAPMCAIGASYSGKIMGLAPVPLTGLLIDNIEPSDSGVYVLDNALAMMKINGYQSGDLIKLNHKSGRILSNFGSGFLTDRITGSGCFTTGVTDWFYDTSTNNISFNKDFSNCFNGSGKIDINYTRIIPSYVNQLLAYGGFLNQTFSVSITTGVLFTGLIATLLPMGGVTGLYNYIGSGTGYAESGYYQLTTGINYNVSGLGLYSDWVAGGVTGYNNAIGWIDYNSPSTFDYISINGKTVSYSSDTLNYQSPDYYSSSGDLIDTINSYPLDFNVSASVVNGKIKLSSLLSGADGNLIELSAGLGDNTGILYPTVESATLTGGANLYRKLYATGFYTGALNQIYLSTGYYQANDAVGDLVGMINSYQGERDFSGLWNMVTGNFYTGYVDFLNDGKLMSPTTYGNIVGDSGYANGPTKFDIGILYTNLYGPTNNTDIAKITITGIGTNSGIIYYLTGAAA